MHLAVITPPDTPQTSKFAVLYQAFVLLGRDVML